jgi:transcriptional regulator with XRE-family HTH domain
VETDGRTFNEWLRLQLRMKKMSQRQLAVQSGVDHSTISRLLRGDRTPSLHTATKLARGLRETFDEADTTRYFGAARQVPVNPVARVEYALRADDALTEPQVRRLMAMYLTFRMRWHADGRAVEGNGRTTIDRPVSERATARSRPAPASRAPARPLAGHAS